MTLQEFKDAIFPSVYKTKGGKLVEITGFAFQGHFLDEEDRRYIWDDHMNFIETQRRHEKDMTINDLITLIKSPLDDPIDSHRKALRKVEPLPNSQSE